MKPHRFTIYAKDANDWLSTEAAPGQNPNTGLFFNPAAYIYKVTGGAVGETVEYGLIYDFLLEVRG